MDCHSIVILTGAGISAESGVPTFRAEDGLWCNHRVEDVATPEAFRRDPELVQRFYNMRRAQLKEIEPNPAHHALARLQKGWPGEVLLVTQNVDNLHDRAAEVVGLNPHEAVLHMHGELTKIRCERTGEVSEWEEEVTPETACHCCNQAGTLRPHIVWFGEMPMQMDRIYRALEGCDLFLSIGTSGQVYPAAGFVQAAKECGAEAIEINLEPTGQNFLFDRHIYGKAGDVVPKLVNDLLYND